MTSNDVPTDVLEAVLRGYCEAALWADCMPPEGSPDDAETGGRQHLAPTAEALEHMREECARFIASNLDDLREYCRELPTRLARYGHGMEDVPMTYAGHDLWLTRNGHGAGFWDRDLGELGERLSDAARAMGEPRYLIESDDGEKAELL